MIKIENISKRFRKLQALDAISADLEKGQAISLIGPNGSGKTTLLVKTIEALRQQESDQDRDDREHQNQFEQGVALLAFPTIERMFHV